MTREDAVWLWNGIVCKKVYGGCPVFDWFTTHTYLANIRNLKEGQIVEQEICHNGDIADFLREWAKALDPEGKP